MDIKPHGDRAKQLLVEIKADVKTFLAWANIKLKHFAGWAGQKLIAYSGMELPTKMRLVPVCEDDNYYTKWREEKEKRVRLEAELAEEKRKH
jgi:hypothetical protein